MKCTHQKLEKILDGKEFKHPKLTIKIRYCLICRKARAKIIKKRDK